MKFLKPTASLIGLSLVLAGCSLSLPFLKTKKAALQVTATPRSTVFLDDKHVGQTPFFDENLKSGEYTLKLVPEDSGNPVSSWETKIKLTPQILTVVNREIGASDPDSSGETLTLEPLSSKTKTVLAIISIPDSAILKLDGQPKGFTPVSVDDVASGEHTIILSAPGFKEKTLKVKITTGHKLTISVQLAKQQVIDIQEEDGDPSSDDDASTDNKPTSKASPAPDPDEEAEAEQIASASANTTKKPYIEVLSNNVGFLRVRSEPTTSSKELAQSVPGQKLPYLDEESNGWYKVTYATGKSGWVARGASGEYAKLVQ